MIFPIFSKEIGLADKKPYGDLVHFRTKYLVKKTDKGYCVYEVIKDDASKIMQRTESIRLIAGEDECILHDGKVNLYDTTLLINLAIKSQKRCTIFMGLDNHITFVLDPSIDSILKIYVYDVTPPYANIYETVKMLERDGVFGELNVEFVNCVLDLNSLNADVYPCRASGFHKTIDKDLLSGGESVAGCEAARLLLAEMYPHDTNFDLKNICPAERALFENRGVFIAKCCQEYRFGLKSYGDTTGYILGWGASPKKIIDAVFEVCAVYREKTAKNRKDADQHE